MIEIIAAYIIDGDTFAVGPQRYRLWGIDAPEIQTRPGRRAQRILQSLMDQEPWFCYPKAQDQYGRSAVQCINAKGADLACTLVDQGAAQDWPRFSGGYYASCD